MVIGQKYFLIMPNRRIFLEKITNKTVLSVAMGVLNLSSFSYNYIKPLKVVNASS